MWSILTISEEFLPYLVRKKNYLPSWRHIRSHLRHCHVQFGRTGLPTAAPSIVFSRFNSVIWLFVSKCEKVTRWTEIWFERDSYRRHRGPLRPTKEVGESLDIWPIVLNLPKFSFFFFRPNNYCFMREPYEMAFEYTKVIRTTVTSK